MFDPVYLKCRSTELQIPIFWLLLLLLLLLLFFVFCFVFLFFHSDVNSMGLRAIKKKIKNSYKRSITNYTK